MRGANKIKVAVIKAPLQLLIQDTYGPKKNSVADLLAPLDSITNIKKCNDSKSVR